MNGKERMAKNLNIWHLSLISDRASWPARCEWNLRTPSIISACVAMPGSEVMFPFGY
jgi:hypothetical protein